MPLRSILALALFGGLFSSHPGRGAEILRFVDDRGQAIHAPLEACFQVETRTECSTVSNGELARKPAQFWSLRVEGADHGPLTAQPQQIQAGADGVAVLRVPRKAELQVDARPALRLILSVYPQDDSSFRAPAFRRELRGGERVKVPAGESLLSLAAPDHAPDLHLLALAPGESRRLKHAERAGWSLVLRCRARKDGHLLAKAAVKVAAAEGYGAPAARPVQELSSVRGLVIVSGIRYALAEAKIEHPGLVPLQVNGLSASPGTFAFREVELERGATLRASVTLDGHPGRGVACQILEYDPNPRGQAPEPKVLSEATADGAGICRFSQLPAGPYTLRLKAVAGRSFVDRSVELAAGEEMAVDVSLRAIHLAGQVLRGSKPASSYFLTFSDLDQLKPNASRRDAEAEATTDEEGRYSAILWAQGYYLILVHSPEGTPGASRRLRFEEDDDHVDFNLEDAGIAGVVVDEKDKRVEGASVYLTWNLTSHRMGTTDAQGAFSFPVAEPGSGKVQAAKSGYLAPDPTEVVVKPDTPPAPLVIRLKKSGTITAHLNGALGPAVGASVQSFRVDSGGRTAFLGTAVAGAEGAFEVAAAEGVPTRLFVTGSGCPLSVFDVQPGGGEDLTLPCPAVPASLVLTLQDPQSKPLAGRTVLLRRQGIFFPESALIDHLSRFHLPAASDGAGRVFLVGLAPGQYEIYLGDRTDPTLVPLGAKQGFLTSADLSPAATVEMAITIDTK